MGGCPRLRPVWCAHTIILALGGGAFAAPQDNQKPTGGVTAQSADAYPDIIELDVFGGVSMFGQVQAGLGEKLITGGDIGGRAAWNFSRHLGAEVSYSFLVNNVRLVTPIAAGLPSYNFGDQIHYPALNLVYNITPRGSRFQPYVTVGGGGAQFTPTAAAKAYARNPAVNAIFGSAALNDNLQVAANYGGGVKYHLSDHLGLRLDVRGFWSPNPTFGLPNTSTGGIYIPAKKSLKGVQATLGLVWYIKQPYVAPPPAPPPPPAPLNVGEITGPGGTLCQNKAISLHSTASDPAGHSLTYAWKLNGSPQGPVVNTTSSNSPDFSFTPNNAGDFKVEVTITDSTNPARTVTAGPLTLTVQEYVKPQITSVSAAPTTLSCAADANGTHSANLSAQVQGSACGGNLTYKWTVSEGSVTNDTSANASFDSSSLNFEGAGGQTKTVTATLTATDETGNSASQSASVTVNCPPQFKRLADVIFAKGKARVNNCGKRILIDQAASQAGTAYDVVLVGHRTADESQPASSRRKRAAPSHSLDEQRALNAAAVLTGGSGTCGNFDPAQVKVDWVGTDSTSTPDPGLCGTSNLPPTTKERRGSQVSEADKDRRVEVYLVPRNSQAMPPAVKNARQLPESQVKALGCPK